MIGAVGEIESEKYKQWKWLDDDDDDLLNISETPTKDKTNASNVINKIKREIKWRLILCSNDSRF